MVGLDRGTYEERCERDDGEAETARKILICKSLGRFLACFSLDQAIIFRFGGLTLE